jgi:hypothetical protein
MGKAVRKCYVDVLSDLSPYVTHLSLNSIQVRMFCMLGISGKTMFQFYI